MRARRVRWSGGERGKHGKRAKHMKRAKRAAPAPLGIQKRAALRKLTLLPIRSVWKRMSDILAWALLLPARPGIPLSSACGSATTMQLPRQGLQLRLPSLLQPR